MIDRVSRRPKGLQMIISVPSVYTCLFVQGVSEKVGVALVERRKKVSKTWVHISLISKLKDVYIDISDVCT